MWGKILGALFGLAILKLPGLVIGVLIGHWFDRSLKGRFEQQGGFDALFRERQDEQGLFMYSSFAVMGHIAKATGVVTSAHISQANHFMAQLELTAQQQREAQAAFRDGKAANFPLQQQLKEFYQAYRSRKDVLQLFLEIQISTACAEGDMVPEQYQLLQQVAAALHFSRIQLEQLLRSFQAHSRFSDRRSARNSAATLSDAYSVLGVTTDVSEQGLKKAYKKLMAQHHPDKLMAQGVPKEMLEVAKKRTQEIQAAYEVIRQQRTSVRG
ncbi:co-chaperone DjlA [Chromatiaceae bacterium AAb-1]|nr:co-chaperone DjlA [Chromatiaceae bacterium AAb-1]